MGVWLSSKRVTQPQDATGISAVSGATAAFLLNPALGLFDLVSHKSGTLAANALLNRVVGPDRFAASQSFTNWKTQWASPATGSNYTVIAVILDSLGRGAYRSVIDSDSGSGTGRVLQFRCNTSDSVDFIAFNSSQSAFVATSAAITSATAPSVIAGRVNGTEVAVWVNGVKTVGSTLAGTAQGLLSSNTLQIGNTISSASFGFLGNIYTAIVFNGGVPDAVLNGLKSPGNVWQLFEDEPLYIPSASGLTLPTLGPITGTPGTVTSTGFGIRVTAI